MMLVLGLLYSTLLAGVGAAEAAPAVDTINLQGKAGILMDAESGQILYQKDAETPYAPASMAKMMTEYLVEKAVQDGKIKWDEVVTVKENAAKQIGSRVFLAVGDKHTVKELYVAMAVASANDASVQLAEFIAGSEEAFAQLMNETAKKLGMNNSHFINATGLDRADMPADYRPKSIDGETRMSAKDSAILAYHILKEMPEFLDVAKIPSLKFRERDTTETPNWNWMLESNKNVPNFRKFAYPGVDGLKTGHTSNAGNCFTGTSLRNGTRLIAVVMGVPGGLRDGKRFLETAKLFDYGFNNFGKQTIVEGKAAVKDHETLKVKKGKQTSVPVITASDVSILAPKGTTIEITETTVKSNQEPLMAPIKQGDKVGTATFKYNDPSTGEAKTLTVDLLAAEDVKKGSWWRLMFRAIGGFFSGLFNGVVNLF
ncbi:D-alanyl-D-alanine carboxypeptidase [Cohnella pontilimi]|uniref:serine-type D-Ala-D-Ala carboxypeptidase n=1 Tax=Cohnella pontilimi TaxID=2564100 RepID=A0A4U0F3C7_9BACL|nr:D-alanyl-D-alanine carboxypeptidase [Cohnella pontilimi]